jgi:enamine deaminase RidA (YjgF/YER057c/UK114 family)
VTPIRRIAVPEMPEPPGASWSNCLVVGREVVLSGVTARSTDGQPIGGDSMQAQTSACLDKVFAQLRAAGGGSRNVYKLVIHVTDITRKDEVIAARRAAFDGVFPASTLLEVSALAFPDLLVEIDAFANLDHVLTPEPADV